MSNIYVKYLMGSDLEDIPGIPEFVGVIKEIGATISGFKTIEKRAVIDTAIGPVTVVTKDVTGQPRSVDNLIELRVKHYMGELEYDIVKNTSRDAIRPNFKR